MNKNLNTIFCKQDFDGKDVFEVGCGYGSFTLEYLIDANSIFGIDTDPEAVESIKSEWTGLQTTERVEFQEGDIVDINLDGKAFNWVVFSNSF